MARKVIQEGAAAGGEPMGAINVTSLVDVMFCLLIMFMVATPLMSPEGMDVDIPAGRGEEITEEEFFYTIISVDKAGKVFLGTLPLSADKDKMAQELAANVKIKEDGKVFIQGDQNVPYERIVDVLVALKEAEVSSVGFVADPNMKKVRGQ
ncbi:MAG: biopolymer transporter ExbD [Myxococcota bacterium]